MDKILDTYQLTSKKKRAISPVLEPKGLSCCSIPFKFQTTVISNSERKGFNSQTKRFPYIENENPGPGFYDVIDQSTLLNNVSQSRKGTCFFPSLFNMVNSLMNVMTTQIYLTTEMICSIFDTDVDTRIARQRIHNFPAANAYNLPPTLISKRDFSLGYSSMFQRPIARKISKRSTPAPNQYNVSVDLSNKGRNTGAKSVFSSKTKRALALGSKEHVPSPCHYRVKDSFIRQAPTVLVSCFRSKTSRETKTETLSPGPAAYQQPAGIPVTPSRKFPGLRKYGLNFSAPAAPRPKTPPAPGPGQYEIVDYESPTKHYISSAVFVSNTGRWAADKSHEDMPGPGAYNIPVPQKQSFIYNTTNKWVPVL
ncbi:O(6)-methylguanine-induced apoptosis 2 isoform X1 [Zootoca vivipara]|uniref:O(6)-methylguanine-induced apoptosis 2 isoform X1 n=1 Tax=Zootoca vivipara TaxID=8524 RepID=UPI00293BB4D1|nr:O(6)-methylguanine-induced apoptosis 2 isoform X1 [Zootoca vivipara]